MNRLLATLLLLLSVASAQARQTAVFDASEAWFDSGYYYEANQSIMIHAYGAHADNPSTDNWVESPAGHNRIAVGLEPVHGVPENGLLVRAGGSGTPTFIGVGGVYQSTTSGTLRFMVNDGDLTNNVGTLLVHILPMPIASVFLPVEEAWVDTGFDCAASEGFFVCAWGMHADNPATANWVYTPAGHPTMADIGAPLAGAPDNALIGRIGVAGDPFFIGAGGKCDPGTSGRLYAMVNDALLPNNVGRVFLELYNESPTAVDEPVDNVQSIQVFPNPMTHQTRIRLGPGMHAVQDVYIVDVAGRHVRTLSVHGQDSNGYGAVWDARDDDGRRVPSGSYFVQLHGSGGIAQGVGVTVLR